MRATCISPWLLAASLLLACAGDKAGDEDDEGGGDDTADLEPITYPSGDRIFMYTGAGGYEEDSTGKGGVDNIDVRWKDAFGWNTDVQSTWPEDLSPYRTIFLMAPGSSAAASFDPTAVEALVGALEIGTRIVVLAELSMCGDAAVSQLLADLGTEMRFSGESTDANRLIEAEIITPDLQVNEGVETFRLKEPCWVDPTGGISIGRDDDRNHYGGLDRPGRAGDIVLMGNFEFLDDGDLIEYGDNGTFADNLVLVEPSGGAED